MVNSWKFWSWSKCMQVICIQKESEGRFGKRKREISFISEGKKCCFRNYRVLINLTLKILYNNLKFLWKMFILQLSLENLFQRTWVIYISTVNGEMAWKWENFRKYQVKIWINCSLMRNFTQAFYVML